MDNSFAIGCAGPTIASTSCVPARLLLVEDNASASFAIRAYFERVGYDVDTAADHASATQLLENNGYDVVITDLNLSALPSNEGMDIVSQARRRHSQACVIMLTGFGSAEVEEEARRRGADMFCAKPIGLRDLSLLIDEIRRSRASRTPSSEQP